MHELLIHLTNTIDVIACMDIVSGDDNWICAIVPTHKWYSIRMVCSTRYRPYYILQTCVGLDVFPNALFFVAQ